MSGPLLVEVIRGGRVESLHEVDAVLLDASGRLVEAWGDAPRPVLLLNGIEDKIFPIEAARQGYAKLQQVYQVLGAQENIDADFFQGGHRWSNNKSLAFLKQHFGE